MAAIDLTAARLRELLDYDPETGEFRWRGYRPGLSTHANPVGWINPYKGRRVIRVEQSTYRAARLAWLHHYGEWPSMEVDHIDGNKLNDRIANLRDVSRSMNEQNKRTANIGKKTGNLRGAFLIDGRWRASIGVSGRVMHLGSFDTEDDAHGAYIDAKRKFHPGFLG